MGKKYLLCVGHVTSKNDGELHFIDGPTLANLYGVPMAECLVWDHHKYPSHAMAEASQPRGYINLYPDYWGKYELPEVS